MHPRFSHTASPMYHYSSLDDLTAAPTAQSVGAPRKSSPDPVSFVVDLRELGLNDEYRTSEVTRAAMCPLFTMVGPEYVNPWNGKREVAGWLL